MKYSTGYKRVTSPPEFQEKGHRPRLSMSNVKTFAVFFFFLITTFINFIPQRQNSQCLHTHSFLSSSPSLTPFTPGHLLHVSFFFSIYLMCFPLCEITTTTIVALKKKKIGPVGEDQTKKQPQRKPTFPSNF